MDNQELEVYAQKVLEDNKELFGHIKSICNDLLNNDNIEDIDRYYSHQDKLTGIYGTLNVVYKRIRAYKKNKEVEYYNALKIEADADNTRFVSTVAERKASLYVSPLRTTRDILEGYIESIVTSIQTCRSHIWEARQDRKMDQ